MFDVILKNVIFGKVFYVEGFSKFVEMFIKNWYWERDEIKLKEMFFVKLSFLKLIKNMWFYKIVFLYGDVDVNIWIVLLRNEKFEIYIRYKVRLILVENNF